MHRVSNKGSWVFFEAINFASKPLEIVDYFAKHGIPLTEDDIEQGSHGTLVSIPDSVVVDMVNQALGGDPLTKWPVIGRRWVKKAELR